MIEDNYEVSISINRQQIIKYLGLIIVGVAAFIYIFLEVRAHDVTEVAVEVGDESFEETKIAAEISGAVEQPGVYELEFTARISDLVFLSGGFTQDAAVEWVAKELNLARILVDEEKIYIPYESEISEEVIEFELNVDQQEPGRLEDEQVFKSEAVESLNINEATKEELLAFEGIGEAYAERLVTNMPYNDKDSLYENSTVPAWVLDGLFEQVDIVFK